MKIKTSELDGAELDYAVAKCEEWEVEFEDGPLYFRGDYFRNGDPCKPSTNWGQGGPIIERESINIRFITPNASTPQCWAYISRESDDFNVEGWGYSPLVAAMRCYVASKLGDEVEVPEEVTNEST